MSGWHSLSGYLYFRAGGGISLLKTKRKFWCVLEESLCQLQYYKSENDVHNNKEALGVINLKGAAISLDLDSQNQFIIICEGKEYIFTADNHESMMIWLLGLQTKRDKIRDEDKSEESKDGKKIAKRRISDLGCLNNKQDAQSQSSPAVAIGNKGGRRKMSWHSYKSSVMVDSIDSAIGSTRSGCQLDACRSRSLPPVFEAIESPGKGTANYHAAVTMSKSLDNHRTLPLTKAKAFKLSLENLNKFSGLPGLSRQDSSSGADSDDVFGEFNLSNSRKSSEEKRPPLTKMETIDSACGMDFSSEQNIGSSSSLSVSSDSAIDRGDASSAELASRLVDLEKELISTKCELAQVMNRQTCYQELLAQRDDAIKFLEGRLDTSEKNHVKGHQSKSSSSPAMVKAEKELQERIRVLQNQNRFLNEEVKKLAKLRQTDKGSFHQQEEKLRCLEAEIDKWKIDYVSLIQSSIRFPGGDTMDEAELMLYGGDRHKKRIKSMLDEARRVNPSLPTYESLSNGEVHVDAYGFKHVFSDNGLLLHYLCMELTQHYTMQAGTYEEHQRRWTYFMRQHGKCVTNNYKELKHLCRGGIPDRFRRQVWRQLIHTKVKDVIQEKGQHYFRNLCNILPDSPLASCYRKQISLDLMRTMPSNVKFCNAGSKGIMDLQDVLLAYCLHNPSTGYCQGMNFIVGVSLLFMESQDAFWALVAVAEHYFSNHYFDHNLIGAQSDQQVLKDLMAEKLPNLKRHLESIDIEISTVTLNWFLAIFFDAVPFQTLLRIWDCFLLEGPKVLFRFALAILKIHEKEILLKSDTISIMRHLKSCAKLTYDIDGLIKVAFEEIRPFPRRHDIATKQTCYINLLKEKYKKKELQRMAFAERERLYMAMEAEAGNHMGLGCAVIYENGKAWLCYGDQSVGKICKVNSEESIMYDLQLEFDARVMCLSNINDVVLLGTLSWMIYTYSAKTKEELWSLQLHDAVLSLCCYVDEDSKLTRTFAGLADGTLAVIEQGDIEKLLASHEVMYIPVGQAPIASLLLLDEHLWCASGNTVYIIHARTLDGVDSFNVSINPYDHILTMVVGDYGIWITLRGSSILELWDPKSLSCKTLYDTRTDRYPQLRKEDDTYFNRARITAVLDVRHSVWVGTGEGNLIIYELTENPNIKTPTDQSPCIETMSNLSANMLSRQRSPNKQPSPKQKPKTRKAAIIESEKKFEFIGSPKPKVKKSPMSEVQKPIAIGNGKEGPEKGLVNKNLLETVKCHNKSSSNTSEETLTPKSRVNSAFRTVNQRNAGEKSGETTPSDKTGSLISPVCDKKVTDPDCLNNNTRRHKSDSDDTVKSIELGQQNVCKSDHSDTSNKENRSDSKENALNNVTGKNGMQISRKGKVDEHKMCNNKGSEQTVSSSLSQDPHGSAFQTYDASANDVFKNGTNGIGAFESCDCLDDDVVIYGNHNKNCPLNPENRKARDMNANKTVTESGELLNPKLKGKTVGAQSSHSKSLNDLDQSLICDDKVMSRHHKVNSWLCSLENNSNDSQVLNEDEIAENHISDVDSDVENCSDVQSPVLESPKTPKIGEVKQKSSDSNDEIFYSASERKSSTPTGSKSSGKVSPGGSNHRNRSSDSEKSEVERKKSDAAIPNKFESMRRFDNPNAFVKIQQTLRRLSTTLTRQDTMDSEVTSIISESEVEKNVSLSAHPETKYRLDFSGMHVDTDTEFDPRRGSETLSEFSFFNAPLPSRNENMLHCPGAVLTERSKLDDWSASVTSTSGSSSDHKLMEFMQTPTLISRRISMGRRDLLEWDDLCSNGKQSSISPVSSVDPKVREYLRTPSLSSRPSSVWSSYDEISTPSTIDEDGTRVHRRVNSLDSYVSHTASTASIGSLNDTAIYNIDLILQAKVKIADKPVRCFLQTTSNQESVILSFSGCYGDDESVLKWRKEPNEKIWTNEPVLEICPKTKMTRLPSYMRNRLSSTSSQGSNKSSTGGGGAFSFKNASSSQPNLKF